MRKPVSRKPPTTPGMQKAEKWKLAIIAILFVAVLVIFLILYF